MSQPPLNLGLSDPTDGEADRQFISALEKLVNGNSEAVAAATTIDGVVTGECQKAYSAALARSSSPPNNNAAVDGEQFEDAVTPAGWLHYVWRSIGKAAIAIPHDHPGQHRLVSLLQEMARLPSHNVPWVSSDGIVYEQELWALDAENKYSFLPEAMSHLSQAEFTGGRQIEEGNPETVSRYVNFSAFLARLLAAGVVELSQLSALNSREFLGSESPYNKEAQKSEPYVVAAAQWISHAGVALFELCDKKAYAARPYNLGWWEKWKGRFTRVVAVDSGFEGQVRDAAAQALEKMAQAEKQGVGALSVIEAFGLDVKEPEEEEE